MKTFGVVSLLVLAGSLFFGLYHFRTGSDDRDPDFFYRVTAVEKGYGYQIFEGERLLIRQDFIPVIPGKVVFKSENDAGRVAGLVVDKLQNDLSPIISIQDLNALGIVYLNQ